MTELVAYLIFWSAYLFAAMGLCFVFWRLSRRYLIKELAYILRALFFALLFTPWYVIPDAKLLAPAFMISLLDTITISGEAGIRAMVPVVLSMISALILVLIGMLLGRFLPRS